MTSRSDIEQLVLKKINTMSFSEVVAFLEGPAPRARAPIIATRGRKVVTRVDTATVTVAIIDCLKKHPNGLRLEGLREGTGLDNPSLSKALHLMLESGALKKTGEKRTTTYSLSGSDAEKSGRVIRGRKK